MGRDDDNRRGVALLGAGYAVPERVVDNSDIAAALGVDEAWLSRRSGTKVRHVASSEERIEDFATEAALMALKVADVDPAQVDTVLVGTTSSDEMSPHTAPLVADNIGARGATASDISSACVGFLSSLHMAAGMIESGRANTAVVVGADLLSRYLDHQDPQSAMLFGDGAGAVVLSALNGASRVGAARFGSDGAGRGLIQLPRDSLLIRMDGPAVYRKAVTLMSELTSEVLELNGCTAEDVDLFVYHQANGRILSSVGDRLGLDPAKVINVVDRFANTSSGSLPIALAVAAEEGRLHPGDRVLLAAFGAGLVWGATLVTWGP